MNLASLGSQRRRRRIRVPAPSSRLGGLAGVVLIAVAAGWGVAESRSLDRRRQAAVEELERLRQAVRDREQAEARLSAARDARDEARRLQLRVARWVEERRILAGLLRGLSRRIRDDVVLDTLRRDGGGFAITGRAVSGDAVTAALRELGRLESIAELDLLFVEREGGGGPPGDASEDSLAEGTQRFALEGVFGYSSPEPEPFGVVVPAGDAGR